MEPRPCTKRFTVWFGLPENRAEKRLVNNALMSATKAKPIRFYIGSCPDYSHNGQIYTHEGLGEGVPLLTQRHLECDRELFMALERNNFPFEAVIMIADVEAIDEIFSERFTSGDKFEFLRRCESSRRQTEAIFHTTEYGRYMRSSSFFMEFGMERFLDLQERYKAVLMDRYRIDGSFQMRIQMDILARSEMYRKMYPLKYNREVDRQTREAFLVERTLRTMAQYLTLGRLVGEKQDECFPMIIVHPTRNKYVFNERNRFLLPDDPPQPQPTIPIFEMKTKVY